jgi:hypothetical protein
LSPYLSLKIRVPHKGRVINRLFNTIANRAPGAVEFQIHQVVPPFQISIASKEARKNLYPFFSLSINNNKGAKATKISKVKGETGHAKTSNNPVKRLKIGVWDFFKKINNLKYWRQVRTKVVMS